MTRDDQHGSVGRYLPQPRQNIFGTAVRQLTIQHNGEDRFPSGALECLRYAGGDLHVILIQLQNVAQVRARVDAAAAGRGLSREDIVSGAGHDAQEMARVCTAGMIFVPGEHDGISHNPRELSTPEQCANGVNVLLDVLLSFADEAEGA